MNIRSTALSKNALRKDRYLELTKQQFLLQSIIWKWDSTRISRYPYADHADENKEQANRNDVVLKNQSDGSGFAVMDADDDSPSSKNADR